MSGYCCRFVDGMHKALGSAGGCASAMINQKPLFPRLAWLQTPHPDRLSLDKVLNHWVFMLFQHLLIDLRLVVISAF